MTCSRALGTNVGMGGEVVSVRAVRDEPLHVRGIPERTAKVVTVRLSEPGGGGAATYHVHAVRDRGRWTWILGGPFLDAVVHGRCLDGSPLAARKPSA